MKLYTEEQMAKVWMAGQKYWETSGASITFEELLEHEKPIELPSDENIEEKAEFLFPTVNRMGGTTYIAHKSFIEGAKWMKDKIINQNK